MKERGTKDIIAQLVWKNMNNSKENLDRFIIPKNAKTQIQVNQQKLQKRKKLFLTKNVMDTMMAISQGSTIVNYGMSHYCNVYKTFVNTNHMKECNLVNQAGDPTRFNKVVRNHRLIDLDKKTQIEVIANMIWLQKNQRTGAARILLQSEEVIQNNLSQKSSRLMKRTSIQEPYEQPEHSKCKRINYDIYKQEVKSIIMIEILEQQ
ncbi:hypothetical protein OXYTRIMIC_798 [Oxytricha trifallax]|uniref:Uncharacterized protein n=1 Tax=Oxytricha trifallax TaxID=1172189 RepID=A0A073HXG1_9SPIT|nr:hypothetical protein OXYTRIMIC_798 [Oxytricha trifallax]